MLFIVGHDSVKEAAAAAWSQPQPQKVVLHKSTGLECPVKVFPPKKALRGGGDLVVWLLQAEAGKTVLAVGPEKGTEIFLDLGLYGRDSFQHKFPQPAIEEFGLSCLGVFQIQALPENAIEFFRKNLPLPVKKVIQQAQPCRVALHMVPLTFDTIVLYICQDIAVQDGLGLFQGFLVPYPFVRQGAKLPVLSKAGKQGQLVSGRASGQGTQGSNLENVLEAFKLCSLVQLSLPSAPIRMGSIFHKLLSEQVGDGEPGGKFPVWGIFPGSQGNLLQQPGGKSRIQSSVQEGCGGEIVHPEPGIFALTAGVESKKVLNCV